VSPALHQFVPSLLPGDATGQHTLALRDLLRRLGVESEIFVETPVEATAAETHHFTRYPRLTGAGGVLLYQAAIWSELADFCYARPEVLVVDYHNLTPASFWAGWEPAVATSADLARAQLQRLSDRTTLALADSAYNESELLSWGYGATAVVPILADLEAFDRPADRARLEALEAAKADGGADWLFVGRIAPNKAQEDLVKALFAARKLYDPRARLHLVGRSGSASYLAALRRLVAELGLEEAVDLPGGVSAAELAAYYRSADCFVVASRHEGFCVPVLEAFWSGVPVVARAEAALPETIGDAGLVLEGARPLELAAAVAEVTHSSALARSLVARGRARLERFARPVVEGLAVQALSRVLPELARAGAA